MEKKIKLGVNEQWIVDSILEFRILWYNDVDTKGRKRAIKSMIEKGLIEFEKNDDNGGSIEFTDLGCEMFGFVWNDGIEADTLTNQLDEITPQECAKIAPKKVILKVCEHCGIEYEAERNSSRFHSAQCRVAHNRQLKKKAKHIEPIYDALYKICRNLDNDKRDKHHEAVLELINIKKYVDIHLSWIARWWQCETCKQSVMVFCPDDEHCQCGKAAKWFIMNTRA